MAMMSIKSSTLEQPAALLPASAPSTRAARSIWQITTSLGARLMRVTVAAYRRLDAHQRRVIDVAAERDNVHLLFPRVH